MPSLLRRRTRREDSFTMIELLVVVIIIAILAAIAVPVYLNIKAGASRSALRQDVNTAVKKVSLALVGDVDHEPVSLDTIMADTTGKYIPLNLPRGEVISVVAANTDTTTTAAYVQDGNGDPGYTVRPALATSTTGTLRDGVAYTRFAAADNTTPFFVYGVLAKSQGAPVDYSYSYTSAGAKYSQGTGAGSSTTASAPSLTTTAVPQGTIGQSYSTTIAATGTPAPTFSYTGSLPSGITLDPTSGTLAGTPNDTAGTYTVVVKAANGAGSDSKSYSLKLVSPNYAPTFTGPAAGSVIGTLTQNSTYPNSTPVVSADALPAATFSAPSGATTTTTAALPQGIVMQSDGSLSGTANTADATGTYTFTVTATNSEGSSTRVYKFTLNAFTPITIYSVSSTVSPYFNSSDWTLVSNGSFNSNALYFTQATYGASGRAYYTATGLQVGHTYKITSSFTYQPGWDGINCGSGGGGYSSTSTTTMTSGNTFTATADTMRVYAWGAGSGTGTLRCRFTSYSLQQTN